MTSYSPEQIVVSCEHGGRQVPADYAALFAAAGALLDSHRAWDPGSAELAEALAATLEVAPVIGRITRLLVDLNRSPGHPRRFSTLTRRLPPAAQAALAAEHYLPHRQQVERLVRRAVAAKGRALHISVHTFTPELDGKLRQADVALLYDPRRARELSLCRRWAAQLARACPDLRVRRNYPYKGVSDGLTTFLRTRFPDAEYQGVELEVNQRWPEGPEGEWRNLIATVARVTRDVLMGRADGGAAPA